MTRDPLIDRAAAAHGLDPALVRAVVAAESGGDTFAIRYEPRFFDRYVQSDPTVKARTPCTLETEKRARATSWGLMQVMGSTARGLGFDRAFLSRLSDPETGLEYGCRYLARLAGLHRQRLGWPGVVAAYNAGSPRLDAQGDYVNQAYVDNIARLLGGTWPQ